MKTMSKSSLRLHFLSLLLLCCVSPSSSVIIRFITHNHFDGLVRCHPHKFQALTQFKNEFDTRRCNHSNYFNGIWCDNSKVRSQSYDYGTVSVELSNQTVASSSFIIFATLISLTTTSPPLPSLPSLAISTN